MLPVVLFSISKTTSTTASKKKPMVIYVPPPKSPAQGPARVPNVQYGFAKVKKTKQPRVQRAVMSGAPMTSVPLPSAVGTVVTNAAKVNRVVHRELVAAVTYDGATTNKVYRINPRNPTMFPWLSQIARAYDYYRIAKMVVEYVPAVPSTTAGQLTMAFDYDVLDANTSTTSAVLQSYVGAVTSQVYIPASCYFHPENTVMKSHKYFCSSATLAERLNDVANLIVNLNVSATTATGFKFGSLFVSYDVEFFNPEITASSLSDAMTLVRAAITEDLIPASNLEPFGDLLGAMVRAQIPGFDETNMISATATALGQGYRIVNGIWEVVSWVSSLFSHRFLRDSLWTTLSGDGVETPGRSSTVITHADMIVIPHEVSDFIVVYMLQGLWAPITGSPVLSWDFTGCTAIPGQFNGYYSVPLYTTSARYMASNQDIIFGFRMFHKDPGSFAAIAMYFDPAVGTWSGTVGARTNVKVLAAPTLTTDGAFNY